MYCYSCTYLHQTDRKCNERFDINTNNKLIIKFTDTAVPDKNRYLVGHQKVENTNGPRVPSPREVTGLCPHETINPAARAIEVPHAGCKDEFGRHCIFDLITADDEHARFIKKQSRAGFMLSPCNHGAMASDASRCNRLPQLCFRW